MLKRASHPALAVATCPSASQLLEGVAAAIPSVFDYPSFMTVLTEFRRKRIRKADADDIARIADQENYWTVEALREILKRIETLNNEDPAGALEACPAALKVAERTRDVSPNLHALVLAVRGSVFRQTGQLEKALATFEKALAIEGIGSRGRGDVLARMAATLVHVELPRFRGQICSFEQGGPDAEITPRIFVRIPKRDRRAHSGWRQPRQAGQAV